MARFAVGLTGGVASGKSTVGDLFAELGVTVVDADQVARDVVEPGQPALKEIRAHFGTEVLLEDGRLDRMAMRQRVFNNDAERARLEAILHPRIHEELAQRRDAAPEPYCLLMIPLMARSKMGSLVDQVLVVDCAEDMQIERLMQRDGVDRDLAGKMLAAQESREQRLAIADAVIRNESAPDDLRQQVVTLHRRYLRLAEQKSRIAGFPRGPAVP